MPKIRINSVQCITPDEADKDEVYLKKDGHKIWPPGELYRRLDTGDMEKVSLDLEIEKGWNEIEIWDFDFISPNDKLGVFKFRVDESPGKHSTTMTLLEKNSTANYVLYWEILDEEEGEFADD
ncbi:MAG: hypothetical protein GDA51_11725 [Ekhidna sp.]|nr:hypothetical protein [Ekhidna sp.]MBC6427103.1 hypothetical protein [Ekhidna sp.]